MGNKFCLAVTGNDRDKVYFWSPEHEAPDPEDYLRQGLPIPENRLYLNMFLVADSFTDFINRLEERPEGKV